MSTINVFALINLLKCGLCGYFFAHVSDLNMGSKNDLRRQKKFVCWRSTPSVSVLNLDHIHESRQVLRFVY
jgi:hypothetical protein